MLSRPHRLRQTKQIQHVLRYGQCIHTPYVRICVYPGAAKHTRLACVVGKSVHRSAVRRHRYQRWLREIARAFVALQPLPTPYDMVWIAQPAITQVHSLKEVTASINPHLQNFYVHQPPSISPEK